MGFDTEQKIYKEAIIGILMEFKFNPIIKESKAKISGTIDKELKKMIEDAAKKHGVNSSTALNEMLIFFKEHYWDKRKTATPIKAISQDELAEMKNQNKSKVIEK